MKSECDVFLIEVDQLQRVELPHQVSGHYLDLGAKKHLEVQTTVELAHLHHLDLLPFFL